MERLIKQFRYFLLVFILSCAPILERSQSEYSWLSKIFTGQSSEATRTTTTATPTNPALLPTVTGTMKSCAVTPSMPTGLNNAQSVSVDGFGNVYIADTGNNRVVMY
jgi:hypothetical protein